MLKSWKNSNVHHTQKHNDDNLLLLQNKYDQFPIQVMEKLVWKLWVHFYLYSVC